MNRRALKSYNFEENLQRDRTPQPRDEQIEIDQSLSWYRPKNMASSSMLSPIKKQFIATAQLSQYLNQNNTTSSSIEHESPTGQDFSPEVRRILPVLSRVRLESPAAKTKAAQRSVKNSDIGGMLADVTISIKARELSPIVQSKKPISINEHLLQQTAIENLKEQMRKNKKWAHNLQPRYVEFDPTLACRAES